MKATAASNDVKFFVALPILHFDLCIYAGLILGGTEIDIEPTLDDLNNFTPLLGWLHDLVASTGRQRR